MNSSAFWKSHSIRRKASQPGNPHSAGQKRLPSKSTSLSPEKAKKILQDGMIRGHKITKKQKGFFEAVAGEKE